jgi:hypothetical protein
VACCASAMLSRRRVSGKQKRICLNIRPSAVLCLVMPSALPYRITLSALASTLGGMVRPICFDVFELMTNSNFVGCSIADRQALCL